MDDRVRSVSEKSVQWDEAADVVIIGSGFAGLSAAIEAREAGASVVVIEKMNAVGGNSVISDGGIAAPGTDLQISRGITDTADRMAADMLAAGCGLNDPALVRVVADQAKEIFDWSREALGVEYLDRVDQFGGHSVARCYTAKHVTGATIINKQMERVNALGVDIRLHTLFTGFVRQTDGRVAGIATCDAAAGRPVDTGQQRHLKAERGIILAAGGFSSDIAFRAAQHPRLNEMIDSTNKPFATAEVMKAAIRIGAAPVQLSHIQLGPWASPDEKGYGVGPAFAEYILFQYGVLIDPATGSRFVNEMADRKTLSDAMLTMGHPCVGIA
ncbi:MAG: FAD-dependent oxidoreductase, partial [Bacillota bacterium]|nr:FAD-dependent oxidoreductase [Bacillota bacterium]